MMPAIKLLPAALLVLTVSEEPCESDTCRHVSQDDEDVSALQLHHPRRKESKLPHVIFFLADDLGWANVGFHRKVARTPAERQGRAEVNTPNLDRLVKDGILLERYYSYHVCSPSRCSLQSGRLPVHVNTDMAPGHVWQPNDNVSGFAGIPRNMTGLAQLMKRGGYKTHMAGKWDAGMATPQQTPYGRGYDSWMGYLMHGNDYWTEVDVALNGSADNSICQGRFVDQSLYSDTYRGGVTTEIRRKLGCRVKNPHNIVQQLNATGCGKNAVDCVEEGCEQEVMCLPESCYEEAMFNSFVMKTIRKHEKRDPLFLFYSFHLAHTPLQIPQSYLDKLRHLVRIRGGSKVETEKRLYYAAMVLYMDDMVGRVIRLLKERDMFRDTLIIFASDNGGPTFGFANNYPLKGGKLSYWEGGVRCNAFVSGGYVPERRRGTKFEGVISVADWYATLATIAGVDNTDQAAADANPYLLDQQLLPLAPVDGIPQWDNILNDVNGRTGPLHIGSKALLQYPWKLLVGGQRYSIYQGPLFPNRTTPKYNMNSGWPLPSYPYDCGGGCLYNVERDPTESTDLAADPQYADLLFELQMTLYKLNYANFQPDRGTPSPLECKAGASIGGFYGPFVDAGDFYLGSVHQSDDSRANT